MSYGRSMPRQPGERGGILADDWRHEALRAGIHGGVSKARAFGSGENRRALPDQFVDQAFACARFHHQVIFGSADQAVVERLARHDAARRVLEVGVSADQHWCVAGADADGRLARPIRGLDHRLAACCQHQRNVPMAHQGSSGLPGAACSQPLHQMNGRANVAQHLLDQHAYLMRYLPCPPARAENDGVAPLESDQDLEDEGRHRVCCRHQAEHHSHRGGHFCHLALPVEADLSVPYLAGHRRADSRAGDGVLECLVTDIAHPGFGDRCDRQLVCVRGDGACQCVKERFDPCLAPRFDIALRGTGAVDQRLDVRVGRRRGWFGNGADSGELRNLECLGEVLGSSLMPPDRSS